MKNKLNLLFIITLFLILISISFGINNYQTTQTINKDSIEKKITKQKKYNKNNHNSYLKYYKKKPDLPLNKIITYVNIGLDKPFYTNIHDSTKLNKNSILVNKYISLPKSYIPNNLELISQKYSNSNLKLVKEARKAFESLAEDAKANNLSIIALSAYRSYEYQEILYNNYVKQDGQALADTYSARPGHSEHQTGLAVDVYNKEISYTEFEKTKEFAWMQENAYKYGFVLRYPKYKEEITGYQYEPWHYRYVTPDIAEYIFKNDLTYEEYFYENTNQKP